MTRSEKIAMIQAQLSKFCSPGVSAWYSRDDICTDDGPHGIRPEVLWDE